MTKNNNPFKYYPGKNRKKATLLTLKLIREFKKKYKKRTDNRKVDLANIITRRVDVEYPNLGVTDTASREAVYFKL